MFYKHVFTKRKNQTGRSMIEMLGTISIMAVLTIGGIIGLRYGWNSYRADQIAQELTTAGLVLAEQVGKGYQSVSLTELTQMKGSYFVSQSIEKVFKEEISLSESQLTNKKTDLLFGSYPIAYGCGNGIQSSLCEIGGSFFVEISNVPTGVCKPLTQLLSALEMLETLWINNQEFNGSEELCGRFSPSFSSTNESVTSSETKSAISPNIIRMVMSLQPRSRTGQMMSCHVTADCPRGYWCQDSFCILESSLSGNEGHTSHRCEITNDCPRGYKCKESVCVLASSFPEDTEPVRCCQKTADCPKGYLCRDTFCALDTTLPMPSDLIDHTNDAGNVSNCQKNEDCLGRTAYCSSPNESCTEDTYYMCKTMPYETRNVNGTEWIKSVGLMSWWDAKHFCEARGQKLATIEALQKQHSSLAILFGENHWVWTNKVYEADNCKSYGLYLKSGMAHEESKRFPNCYALCTTGCRGDSDCKGETPVCQLDTQKCVQCLNNRYCTTDKPVCNTAAHLCEACPVQLPVYDTNRQKCVRCLSNTDCLDSTPICNREADVCEACPVQLPVYDTNRQKCVRCLSNTDCPDSTPICNREADRCESCPVDLPLYDISSQKCVQCLTNGDCSVDTPVCNSVSYTCEGCPNGYEYDFSEERCLKLYTVTWRDVETTITQKVRSGQLVSEREASRTGYVFDGWRMDKINTVTFPQKITNDVTYYAYYTPGEYYTETNEAVINKCGGSRLGSENTETSHTFSFGDGYHDNVQVYMRSAWNNDGYNCGEKTANIGWTLTNGTSLNTPSLKHCAWIEAGAGTGITFFGNEDWSKYCDVVFRIKARYKTYPQLTYPY